jgi:hypothetical protein
MLALSFAASAGLSAGRMVSKLPFGLLRSCLANSREDKDPELGTELDCDGVEVEVEVEVDEPDVEGADVPVPVDEGVADGSAIATLS